MADPQAARDTWRAMIEEVRKVAKTVRDGGKPDRLTAATAAGMAVSVRQPFPVPWAIAQGAADGFKAVARAFVTNDFPEVLAPMVVAGADALEALLIQDGHARAAYARRMTGEGD